VKALLRSYRIAYPDVRLQREIVGREALFSSEKAKRLLGFRPRFSWRPSRKPYSAAHEALSGWRGLDDLLPEGSREDRRRRLNCTPACRIS
jgi:hypothetical protein